jgi:hypothetical protein
MPIGIRTLRTTRRFSRGVRAAAVTAGVAAAVALAVWIWKDFLEDRFIPKRWGAVVAGKLYRSGQLSSALVRRVLEEHGIRVIVDLTGGLPGDEDQVAEARAADELKIERLLLPLDGDGTGDIRHYAAALTRIHRALQDGAPVLIHCAAGSQRTGAAVAAYRLLCERAPSESVLAELESYDWDPDDDRVLVEYLDAHLAELARLLVEDGVLDKAPDPLPKLGP